MIFLCVGGGIYVWVILGFLIVALVIWGCGHSCLDLCLILGVAGDVILVLVFCFFGFCCVICWAVGFGFGFSWFVFEG